MIPRSSRAVLAGRCCKPHPRQHGGGDYPVVLKDGHHLTLTPDPCMEYNLQACPELVEGLTPRIF
jgi:hypothetical protein